MIKLGGHSNVDPGISLALFDEDKFCQVVVAVDVVGGNGEIKVEDLGIAVLTLDNQAFRSKIVLEGL